MLAVPNRISVRQALTRTIEHTLWTLYWIVSSYIACPCAFLLCYICSYTLAATTSIAQFLWTIHCMLWLWLSSKWGNAFFFYFYFLQMKIVAPSAMQITNAHQPVIKRLLIKFNRLPPFAASLPTASALLSTPGWSVCHSMAAATKYKSNGVEQSRHDVKSMELSMNV